MRRLTKTLFLVMLAVVVQARKQKKEERKPLGCFDTLPVKDCEFMRDEDFCELDISSLKTKCDKSCGWCSEGPKCVDSATYLDCKSLTKAACNSNVTFYSSRCKKSCGWCGVGVWGPWGNWAECPSACGDYFTRRTRTCLVGFCDGEAEQELQCTNKCPTWTDWAPWSDCKGSCQRAQRNRKRKCTHGRRCAGKSIETEFCDLDSCLQNWKPWGEWSKCSRTCGDGFAVRSRVCPGNNCEGRSGGGRHCIMAECPTWEEWSDWSKCSVTCGKGEKSRKRNCKNGPGCSGKSIDIKPCELPSCSGDNLRFDAWTPCSRTCDSGTTIKLEKCPEMDINICPKRYKDCNTFPCRFKWCRNYRYEGRAHKYSSCCKNSPATCGKNTYTSTKIIGGKITTPKQFPWMARIEAIRQGDLFEHICGGTLIHPQYVVTAAHCIDSSKRWSDPDRIRVVLGSISRADFSTYVQIMAVENFTNHQNFSSNDANDISVIKLKKPVVMTDYIRTICLPNGEVTPLDTKCFIAGWGYRHFAHHVQSTNLMEGRIRILPFDVCMQAYPEAAKHMDEEHMICAGSITGGTDTCEGDSGGPIMCQRCESCSWYLAGVTAFGSKFCGGEMSPGVYTRTSYFEDWITSFAEPSEPIMPINYCTK